MKRCTKCGEEKAFSAYYKMRRGKHGLNSWCKSCMGVARKAWREANRERARTTNLAWRRANPDRTAAIYLKSAYGLTPERRAAMGKACHICGTDDLVLVIDHDHACCPGYRSCGECVRGLLCRKCNLGIGHLDDDIERVRAALGYLERHGARCA